MVPVELRRHFFGLVVGALDFVGFQETGDGFVDPADAAEVMAVHVMRVRNHGSQALVDLAVFQRLRHPVHGFVGMDQVMMRGEVHGLAQQHRGVEADRPDAAALPASGHGRFLGVSSQQPQLDVVGISGDRAIERGFVGLMFRRVAQICERVDLLGANRDAPLLPLVGMSGAGEVLGLLDGGERGRSVFQPRGDARESDVGHRDIGIEPQRLMERARSFQPNVGVQIGDTLVVKHLCLRRFRGDLLVDHADSRRRTHRRGTFENIFRNIADGFHVVGVRIVLRLQAPRTG